MVEVCKIIRNIILCGMFFFQTFSSMGQSVYSSRTVYYNMDTSHCVDRDARFWEGCHLKRLAGNPDSAGLYCKFKENLDLPIVTVNDEKINRILDDCMLNASKSNDLQFPDSSGYFVELFVYDEANDSLQMAIKPFTNYCMSEMLLPSANDACCEWYGYNAKEVQACFFRNDILCVVTSLGRLDYEKVSCLFSSTSYTLRIVLFEPIIFLMKNPGYDYQDYDEFYYCFPDCGSSQKSHE